MVQATVGLHIYLFFYEARDIYIEVLEIHTKLRAAHFETVSFKTGVSCLKFTEGVAHEVLQQIDGRFLRGFQAHWHTERMQEGLDDGQC